MDRVYMVGHETLNLFEGTVFQSHNKEDMFQVRALALAWMIEFLKSKVPRP